MATKRALYSLSALDGSGSTSKIKLWLKDGISPSAAFAGGEDIRSLLSALIGATFVRESVTYGYAVDNPYPADISTDVSTAAVFVFDTVDESQLSMVDIPAIKAEFILDNGVNQGMMLDMTDRTVLALTNAISSGLFCNILGFDITEAISSIIERRRS